MTVTSYMFLNLILFSTQIFTPTVLQVAEKKQQKWSFLLTEKKFSVKKNASRPPSKSKNQRKRRTL